MKRILSDLKILKPELGEIMKKLIIVNVTVIGFTILINISPVKSKSVDMEMMYVSILAGLNVSALISAIVLYLAVWRPKINVDNKKLFAETQYKLINKRFKQK